LEAPAPIPADALLGLAFSQAISSFMSFAGIVFLAKRTTGTVASGAIGREIIQHVVLKRIESAVENMRTKAAEDKPSGLA
jgi:hypothetical protein